MIDIRIDTDGAALASAFQGKAELLEQALANKVNVLNAELQRRIVTALQGGVLNQVTGKAARSVEMIPAAISGTSIDGSVQAGGGPAFYLRFQEEGTSGPYEIVPDRAKALAFSLGGATVFAKRVIHPGLAARRPVGATFDAMRAEIIAGLQAVPAEAA
jgi:hypothetical protein